MRAMEELTAMFPALDREVITAVLRETRNDVGAAVERLLEMSSSAPPAPPPSSQSTVWPRAPNVVKPPSSAWDTGYRRVHGSAGSLRPPTHYPRSQPYYYAGPLQQAAVAGPSSYQSPNVSHTSSSLYSSAQQPAVPQYEWPLVGGNVASSTGQTKRGQLIILRGLPGSGKSTLARKLAGVTGTVLSTDDLFIVNGQYLFDPSKLGENHEKNKQRTHEALQSGLSPIIIDNTNTAAWEMKPYVTMGLESGYEINIVEPNTEWKFNVGELARRNSHGVSRQTIERMMERYERNVTMESILRSQQPPERREPPLARGRMSGNAYSSPPSKRLRDNASPRAPQRVPPSSFRYRGNYPNSRDHLPASRPSTQEVRNRVEPARPPQGAANTQHYHSSLGRDVWSFKDDSIIETGRPSPPSGHVSSDELLSVVAVPHVLLSPEQHSDSSIDDPAIIQKVPTPHQKARPERTESDRQRTAQNNTGPAQHLEDGLLKLFPTADDTALLPQRLALSSQESDSGDYFPSGYLHTEQNEEPPVISTLDEHHKDTAPCMDNHLPMAPPSDVAHDVNTESNVTPYQNEQVPVHACNDVRSSGSNASAAPFTSGPTVECGGVEGDLGFLKECFPDLESAYLEELYQLCERDVEKAVSCVLGYPHTSREDRTEESSTLSVVRNTISQVSVAASDTDAKAATRQVLEYLQTDSGVPQSTWLHHRDKSSATDSGTLPDCVDDEAIARQLQQELDHEVQTFHTTNPPGPAQDEEKITTNSYEAPVGDANLVLTLTPSLAKQLQEMFGSVTTFLPFPGTMRDEDLVVLLSERAAKEIHKKWCDTLEGKRNEYQFHLEKQLQKDESIARELQEVEDGKQDRRQPATGWQDSCGRSAGMKQYRKADPSSSAGGGVSSLSEVMSEQLTEEEKDRETATLLKAACEMNMARTLQLNKLYSDFPQLQRRVINRMLVQNNFDFERTAAELQVVVLAIDTTDGNTLSHKCSPHHGSTKTKRHHPSSSSSSSSSSSPKKHPPTLKQHKSPKSAGKSDKGAHQTPDLTQEEKEQLYKNLRAEATVHANLRAEAFQKAAHARSRKLWEVASFYAQQGHMHTDKMNAANRRAAEFIFKQTNKQSSSDSLDLHGLHVNEALEALQEKLATARKGECVHVITGRGIHSKGREARLKPAISLFLQQNGYTFDEPNAGMLRVRVK